jgi:hypothetical protein
MLRREREDREEKGNGGEWGMENGEAEKEREGREEIGGGEKAKGMGNGEAERGKGR